MDQGIIYICQGLAQLQCLETFKLTIYEENQLNVLGWNTLFEGIASIKSLTTLKLFILDPLVPVNSIKALGEKLKNLTLLNSFEYIPLTSSTIENNHSRLQFLCKNFDHLHSLTDLTLTIPYNSANIQGFRELSNSLNQLCNLINLSMTIQENNIQQEGARQLAQGFKKLVKLKNFCLDIGSMNYVNSLGIKDIGESIGYLKELQRLQLTINSQNYVEHQGSLGLADGITQLLKLKELSLFFYDNYIQSASFITISESFKSLQILEELNLYIGFNNYVITNDLNLQTGLESLTNLKKFSLNVDSKNKYHYNSYIQMIKALSKLPKLIDFQLIIYPIEPYLERIDSQLIYDEITNLKGLQKLKIYTSFKANFQILKLIEELPQIQQNHIDLQYFKGIYFEKESIFNGDKIQLNNRVKKLRVDVLDNENYCRKFCDFYGLDRALDYYSHITHFEFNYIDYYYKKIECLVYRIDQRFQKMNQQKKIEFQQMNSLAQQDQNKFTIDLTNFDLLQNLNLSNSYSFKIDYQQIQFLKVNLNNLKIDGDQILQNLFQLALKCTNLTSLNICLDSTLISDLCLVQIQKILLNSLKFKQLQLNLSSNLITTEGVQLIAKGISANVNLQSISLNFDKNQICSQGLKSLSSSIISLRELKNLNKLVLGFEKNQIESDAAIELGKLIEQTKQLESLALNFNNNKIKTEGAFKICKGVSQCSQIKDLALMFNNIYLIYDQQKYGLQPLGIQISKCRLLKKLILDLGQNSNSSYNELLPILTNCKKLRHLEFKFDSKITELQLRTELNQFYLVIERAININYLYLNIENYTFGTQGGQLLINQLLKCKNLMALQLNLIETNISTTDFESLILESRRNLSLSQFYCTLQQSWLTQLQNNKNKYLKLFKKSAKMVKYNLIFIKSF